MLNWVFGNKKKRRKKPGIGSKPAYEVAREIAGSGSVEERKKLAAHQDLEPEILYFFSTDEEPEVRREVAENVGTPLQADLILSKASDEEVRAELAHKIGRMIPELSPDENEKVTEMTLEVLDVLANDELPRIRAIISEELKKASNVPHDIVFRLAEDLEEIVSVPVLEYSPLLSERDLLEIIARGLKSRALVAVARRKSVTEPVVDAVVETGDGEAVNAVLENQSSRISDKTFDHIAEEAEGRKEWHNAMVYRDDLPLKTVMRIASFVSAALTEALISRNKGDKKLVENLRKTVRQRIERGELETKEEEDGRLTTFEQAEADFNGGVLTEERILQMAKDGENAYIRYALHFLSDIPRDTVAKIINTASAKAITAVSWKAGLAMETAVELQKALGNVSSSNLIRPTSSGDYPIGEDDLEWYLESFF